jgi:hypothetical protein
VKLTDVIGRWVAAPVIQALKRDYSLAWPTPMLWGMFGGSGSNTGIPVTPLSALQSAAVYGCVLCLSEDIGKLPIEVRRRLPGGGFEVDPTHPLAQGLLEQVESEIASFIADGAYDGEPVYQAVARKQHDPLPDVVVPPRASAVLSTDVVESRSQRNRHIQLIAEKGRMGWQRATGYGRRSLVETAIGRYKHLIGSKLRARSLAAQQGEVAIAVEALNHMIRVAKPLSVRVA